MKIAQLPPDSSLITSQSSLMNEATLWESSGKVFQVILRDFMNIPGNDRRALKSRNAFPDRANKRARTTKSC
jgi:hypothetical protein